MDSFAPVINGSINRLQKAVEEQTKATDREAKATRWMTVAALVLAFVQTVATIIQLIPMFK